MLKEIKNLLHEWDRFCVENCGVCDKTATCWLYQNFEVMVKKKHVFPIELLMMQIPGKGTGINKVVERCIFLDDAETGLGVLRLLNTGVIKMFDEIEKETRKIKPLKED